MAQPPEHYGTTEELRPRTTNGFAVASLVLGIVFIWGIGSVLALVFGYIAKNQINQSRGIEGGRGMAIAGIVLGWVGVAGILLMVSGIAWMPQMDMPMDMMNGNHQH